MIKTCKQLSKHLGINLMLMMSMFLLLKAAEAQPVSFSSDHWPKRWGRAMNRPDMSAYFSQSLNKKSDVKTVRQQAWGQQPKEKRNGRSKTPDYNNGFYKRDESEFLKRRYAVPAPVPYSSPYGGYPLNNYYGGYSMLPHLGYPGVMPGMYPGFYPGAGVPGLGLGVPGLGFPYSSPFMLAPGLTPGLGYPW